VAWGKASISVGLEDVRVVGVVAFSSSTPRPEVLPDKISQMVLSHASTNVSGPYT
jgi:hypothetical protein